ncbi:hydroxyacid dehydrogenase [Aureimonas altamirensis]|uniref:hydroxyacid dehydrogenase n=1 Tax=Aureimonas altamirensis TaxID=370622 RepID=UPI002036F1A0|nr:hydroxyacid dehydrogenase [Aureimonas altamirensis]MCM2503151.1 hydroxyacid dehydrogenase [Aureimonas altamirensis]
MQRIVLITAPALAPAGEAILASGGCTPRYVSDYADTEGLRHILDTEPVEGIISRTMHLSADLLSACPSLKVISKHGTGTSNIDVAAASRQGISVFSTPGANARAVAEFSVGLMLAAARRIARFDRSVRLGEWSRAGDGMQLAGKTLGLVGYGRIARQVGDIACAMGMRIVALDPVRPPTETAGPTFCESLTDLLERSDVVSLHCPAVRGAAPLIDERALSRMKHGSILVNTARGELIDEAALVSMLDSGRLAAAALDTFANEPLADGPLRRHPNVILTPHVGGSTPEALDEMAAQAARNVVAYLDAAATGNALPKEIADLCLNPAAALHAERGRYGAVA